MNVAAERFEFLEARAKRRRFAVFAMAYFGGLVAAGALILLEDDGRYRILLVLFFSLLIALLFVRQKLEFLRNILIFSISLRVLNANLGKRFVQLEFAFPNLNVYELLLVLTLLGLIFRWIIEGKRILLPNSNAHRVFVCLVLVFLFSLCFVTPNPDFGFERVITIVEMYISFVVFFNLVHTDKDVKAIIRVLVITVFVEILLVAMEVALGSASPLFQFVAGARALAEEGVNVVSGRRIAGSFGDAVVFGWVMGFPYFFLLPFVLKSRNLTGVRRGVTASCLISVFAFGLLTMTRTSLFAELVLTPFALYFLAGNKHSEVWRWLRRFIVGAAVTAAILLLIPGTSQIFMQRSSDADELSSSLEFRITSWNVGWRILREYPVLGLGVGAGGVLAYSAEGLADFITSPDEDQVISYAGIHNGHAIMLAEMGFLGYGLYLSLLGFFLSSAFHLMRHPRNEVDTAIGVAAIMIVAFLAISDFTGVALAFRSAMNYVALSFALVSARLVRSAEPSDRES